MKNQIDAIIKQPNLSVKEKVDRLEKLKENTLILFKTTREEILKGYSYCPYCDTYYKDKAWDSIETSKTEKVFVNNSYEDHCSLTSIASYWEDKEVPYLQKICPVGHTLEEEKK